MNRNRNDQPDLKNPCWEMMPKGIPRGRTNFGFGFVLRLAKLVSATGPYGPVEVWVDYIKAYRPAPNGVTRDS